MADILEQTGDADAGDWWRRAYETLLGMKQAGLHVSPQDEGFLEQLRRKATE